MRTITFVMALLGLAGSAGAANLASTGHSSNTTIVPLGSDQCAMTLYYNHDNSFENGFCWQYGGVVPGTTCGAFGEGFDMSFMSSCIIECIDLWVTQIGNFSGQWLDLYLWEGGVYSPPGVVLAVVTGVTLSNVPFWPSIGQNSIEFDGGAFDCFTVGYWADFSAQACQWYIGCDEDGFGGFPWTNVAPGIGYPTGWQHPPTVWGICQSLGIGIHGSEGPFSPVVGVTWGAIKHLF
jgi:hypothetical protein